MTLLLLVADDAGGGDEPDAAAVEKARREAKARQLLEEAKRRRAESDKGRDVAGPKVDKYFGTKLPPVCERLGCYLTDDGTRFYCVNSACQKHKKRATKHSRTGRPARGHFVYFRCPKCESKRVEMNLFSNTYHCKTCKYVWER